MGVARNFTEVWLSGVVETSGCGCGNYQGVGMASTLYNTTHFSLKVIELPLMNPELFLRVGITPPKGCLLYGPPGTGKTLLARAVAKQLDSNFLKVVSSAIVDKYIGESARLIREMFGECNSGQVHRGECKVDQGDVW